MSSRNRLHKKTYIILLVLVIVIPAIFIYAFFGTIIFEWGMDYLGMRGGQTILFGSVNGQEIKYSEFEIQLQQAIEQQKQQTGKEPDKAAIKDIREKVWDSFVQQILVQQEIEKLGIKVTDQEILDWIYNRPLTLPDAVKNIFIDSTGQFDKVSYTQSLESKAPEATKFWSQVEDYLRQLLLTQKLQSVITGSVEHWMENQKKHAVIVDNRDKFFK